jgi:hypothetical protein
VASPLGPLAGLVNSVLEAAIKGEHITETTTLHVNTNDARSWVAAPRTRLS